MPEDLPEFTGGIAPRGLQPNATTSSHWPETLHPISTPLSMNLPAPECLLARMSGQAQLALACSSTAKPQRPQLISARNPVWVEACTLG